MELRYERRVVSTEPLRVFESFRWTGAREEPCPKGSFAGFYETPPSACLVERTMTYPESVIRQR